MEKWQELIVFIDCTSDLTRPISSEKVFKQQRVFSKNREDSSIVVSIRDCGSCDPGSIPGSHPFLFNTFINQ